MTTKLLNKIEGLRKEDVDQIKLKQCSIIKQKIIKEIDATIIDMKIENECEDEDCDKEAEACEIGEKITYSLVAIENALKGIKI